MVEPMLHPNWPTRQLDLAIAGRKLLLQSPDNPYSLLDLPGVEKAFAEDDYMPYWAHLWPASLMLADWLIRQVDSAASSRTGQPACHAIPLPPSDLLEIGCGLAAPGLLAAQLGYRVTLSDYDGDALVFAERNARLNNVAARVAKLDWRHPPGERYPFILAADVLYEQRNHAPVLDLLRHSLAAGGLAALSDPSRLVADVFPRAAHLAGWTVEILPAKWEDTVGRILLLRR